MSQDIYRVKTVDARWFAENIKCQSACPADTDVYGYLSLITEGKFDEAYALNKRVNLFPAVLGRVCTHPCEFQCRRGDIDQPVSICALKRFAADHRSKLRDEGETCEIEAGAEKVAIIGAGPVGLTAAYDLAKMGYQVTVFESSPVAGGMLYLGIPEYRLPREVIEFEVSVIREAGVEIKTNSPIDKNHSLNDLFSEGYKAILIAVGAHQGLRLNVPGEGQYRGIMDCIDFLRRVNLGDKRRPGGKVVVIGGGNSAIDSARTAMRLRAESPEELPADETGVEVADSARTALRLGAEEVSILYRRSRSEMPAAGWEVDEAESEGVKIHYLTTPVRILGESGKVMGIECIKMKLGEPDESGRRRPIPIEGTEFIVEADAIIPAISQSPDLSFLGENHGLEISKWGSLAVERDTLATNRHGVFAAGDAVTGPKTVIEGVAVGHRAARSIARYIRGRELQEEPPKVGKRRAIQGYRREGDYDKIGRQVMPTLDPERRLKGVQEVELGLREEQALNEARRCLKCNLNIFIDAERCVLCGGCVEVCPYNCIRMVSLDLDRINYNEDFARLIERNFDIPMERFDRDPERVNLREEGAVMIIKEELCIRCGLCVSRCPAKAITMEVFELEGVTV